VWEKWESGVFGVDNGSNRWLQRDKKEVAVKSRAGMTARGLERGEVLLRRTGPGPEIEREDEGNMSSWERSAISCLLD
jgi:hypothetical protein